MNALTLKIDWNNRDTAGGAPIPIRVTTPDHWAQAAPTPHLCPACGAPVYNRRHPHCGVCEAPLPAECRFTSQEARHISLLMHCERRRHKEWIRRIAG